MVKHGSASMHYIRKERQIQGILESPSAQMGSVCLVRWQPHTTIARVCHSTQSPRADYAKKEHFPDVDNSTAQLSEEEYECVHAAA